MLSRNHLFQALMIALALTLLGGCGKASMRAFDVAVDLHPDLQNSTVRVDLVGVNNAERSRWDSLGRYWSPGDQLRRNARSLGMIHEMQFGGGQPATQDGVIVDDENRLPGRPRLFRFCCGHGPASRGSWVARRGGTRR